MTSGIVRWGFCSAGKVANDFSLAMDSVLEGKHRKVAVAAQSIERVKKFAEDHHFEKFYGTYKELAEDEEIDVVYVSSLNTTHSELSKMFLEHGKHVVCEKPLTPSFDETKDLVDAAKNSNLFFMEAVWSRCFPVYDHVKKLCDEGTIGEVLQIHAHFHLKAASERISNAQLGGGMWIDVGVYLFNLVDFIYDEEPSDIQACGHVEAKSASDDGVDSDVVVNLSYPGGKFASLTTSFRCRRPNSAIISGSNGYIEIKPPFHAPTEFEVYIMDKDTTERHRHDLGGVHSFDKFCYPNSQGFAYEIEHVRECLDKRLKESPLVPWETTLRIARVADKIIQQIRK